MYSQTLQQTTYLYVYLFLVSFISNKYKCTHFFTHCYINTRGWGGRFKDRNKCISYATSWNKEKDYYAFILSFDFQLHSQHLAAIVMCIHLRLRYKPKISIITIMPSLAQKKQQRKQNIKRQGKEGHLSGIPFTHTTCSH
jgi:hypothetical protein